MHTGNGVRLGLNGARRHAENTLEARLAKLERMVEELARSQRNGHQAIGGQPADGGAELHGDDGRVSTTTSAEPGDRPEGQAKEEVALAGQDGAKAEELLKEAKRQGSATLSALLGRALRRHLSNGPQIAGPLFDDAEMAELAKAFEATCGTADLLGRARIREKQQDERAVDASGGISQAAMSRPQTQAFGGYDSAPINALTAPLRREFLAFADIPAIKPFPPARALAYFRRLVPSLDVHPERFGQEQARRAFTLAGNTSLVLREKVQKAISDMIAEGDIPKGDAAVGRLLERTGCSRKNPVYAELVWRTNMIDAYQQGAQEELRHPDVLPDFPAWEWVAVDDNRLRDSHRKLAFDEYGKPRIYPSSITFQQVRDRHGYDGYQDRCNFKPLHKTELQRRLARGERLSTFAEVFGERHEQREQSAGVSDARSRQERGGRADRAEAAETPAGIRGVQGKASLRETRDSLIVYFTERLLHFAGQRFAEQLEAEYALAEQG